MELHKFSYTYFICFSLISAFEHWRTQVSSRKLIQVFRTSPSILHELIEFESSCSCQQATKKYFRKQNGKSKPVLPTQNNISCTQQMKSDKFTPLFLNVQLYDCLLPQTDPSLLVHSVIVLEQQPRKH